MHFVHCCQFGFFSSFAQYGSKPVSKYKESFNAIIGKPVTILAACSCTFSYLLVSKIEQPSQTTDSNNMALQSDIHF